MSAIGGILLSNGKPVDRTVLERMSDLLAHRGPDAAGVWSVGSVGFCQRLLWTTAESIHEKLPLVHHSGPLVLAADARIDNRRDLIDLLGIERKPEEIADSALVLEAYLKWGENCPEKLLGDFAFAIWDQHQRKLFCARDHMGAKPFYYYHSPDLFAFASEIKGLFCIPGVRCQPNELKIADHLSCKFEDRVGTFHKDIWKLAPASSLTVTPRGLSIRKYWSLDPTRELRLGSSSEYVEAFQDVFREAVRCRLRSAFPVGSSLSGGVDSSSIACTARHLLKEDSHATRLHTYSAIFPRMSEADLRKIDERPFINAVHAMGDLEPHFVEADQLSPLAELSRILWYQDQPIIAPNLYIHLGLYSSARQDGVRVFLDGFDGDTTVSHGLERLSQLAAGGRWKTLFKESQALASKSNSSYSLKRILWELSFKPLLPDPALRAWATLRKHPKPASDDVILPEFARRVAAGSPSAGKPEKQMRRTTIARRKHWEALTSPLIPYTLDLASHAASAFSVEARYPFFDRRLMEFCLALPPEQKLSQGWGRMILRRAMEGYLPREVQWRFSKADLSPNFRSQLLKSDRAILDQVILEDPQRIEPYVDVVKLQEVYRRYAGNPILQAQNAVTIYGVVALSLWLRTGTQPAVPENNVSFSVLNS